MINTEGNSTNGLNNGGTSAPAPKKTALRDVQNENVGIVPKKQESLLPGGGKPTNDTIKVCGTKRLTPERPSISKGLQSLAYNDANENIMNVRRRFDLELGKGRLQRNVEMYVSSSELTQKMNQMKDNNNNNNNNIKHVAAPTTKNAVTPVPFPSGGLNPGSSVPRHTSNVPVAKEQTPRTVDFKGRKDHLRAERFIRLQKYLKQCDESNQREYIQMLLHLSPADLSKHAVELEKRAIQLTIEEGNEMQRMKALNILAKSSPTNNLVQPNLPLQSRKR